MSPPWAGWGEGGRDEARSRDTYVALLLPPLVKNESIPGRSRSPCPRGSPWQTSAQPPHRFPAPHERGETGKNSNRFTRRVALRLEQLVRVGIHRGRNAMSDENQDSIRIPHCKM